MEIFSSVSQLRQHLQKLRTENSTCGFVPTMGFLHEGHDSLIRQSKQENTVTVVSIFVNPTQFAPGEDFEKYPRDLAKDIKLLESEKVDILFNPGVPNIYPDTTFRLIKADQELTARACGKSRPGHFDGVVTVVARLFDIVQPDRAYFGLKDYQQYLVIKKMSTALKYPIKIIGCPIVREPDGLALSSRNSYLSPESRKTAVILYQSLQLAKELVQQGENNLQLIKEKIIALLSAVPETRIDYVEILDRESLKTGELYSPNKYIVLLAVYIGKTRLIDNLFI